LFRQVDFGAFFVPENINFIFFLTFKLLREPKIEDTREAADVNSYAAKFSW